MRESIEAMPRSDRLLLLLTADDRHLRDREIAQVLGRSRWWVRRSRRRIRRRLVRHIRREVP